MIPITRVRLTAAEAAEVSRRHPVTIRNALQVKDLHGVQRVKGGRWLIDPACLDAWIENRPCSHKVAEDVVIELGAYRTDRS